MPLTRKSLLLGALALLAGLLLRAYFIAHHPRWGGDTLVYSDLAHNMLSHHIFGFTEDQIRPTLIRLPGYPVFLAGCFVFFGNANFIAVVWVQALLDLLGCVLLAVLAARLFSPRAGMAALWLAALCPFTANYTTTVLTETPTLFCIVLSLYALERFAAAWRSGRPWLRWAVVIGCALACAVLQRPDRALLAAAVVPAMLWLCLRTSGRPMLQRLLPAATASLIVLLPLLLWGLRNERVFHVFQPLAPRNANDPGEQVPFGFQRWYRTWGIDYKSTFDIYWNYDGAPLDIAKLPPRAFDTPAQRASTAALFDRYNRTTSASPELDTAFAAIAAQRIAAHPLRYYVLLPMAREADMWLRPRTEWMAKTPIDWWSFHAHPGSSAFAVLYGLLDAAYLALAVFGFFRWRKASWNGNSAIALAMLGFLLLRCLLLLTLDNSEPRYTVECFPVVILLAACALTYSHPRKRLVNAPLDRAAL